MICSAEFFTPLPGCEQTLSIRLNSLRHCRAVNSLRSVPAHRRHGIPVLGTTYKSTEQDRAVTWNTSSTIYKASTNLTGCINSLVAFAAKDNSMELEGHPAYTS